MKYSNPIVRGMYPDPSVCRANGKYYMVCSTMMYFPAVPLFESDNLVNWRQIGHCLTRDSQVCLEGAEITSGIFAPTIRYNDGRFYMVTTNAVDHRNFYVYTDDIYGEWSDPIYVDQDGIDPTLFFEDGRCWFISNGADEQGSRIQMSEINVETGEIITPAAVLWRGTGGRFMEAPHLYHVGEYYYVLDAEGGTEYGHMVNYGRGRSMMGPFEPFKGNPALTNRNFAPYVIQGAGHGDLIEDYNGNWWFIHLAFRQSGLWMPYHHLGREVCLVPVTFEDGWFTFGEGVCSLEYDIPDLPEVSQNFSYKKTLANISEGMEGCYLRRCDKEKYHFGENCLEMTASQSPFEKNSYPSFVGIRQCELEENICCTVESCCDEAGITLFMDEHHHYDAFVDRNGLVRLRMTIGCASEQSEGIKSEGAVRFIIHANPYGYDFYAVLSSGESVNLGYADTKYLSSEVAGGFTGVVTGLYAVGSSDTKAVFTDLLIEHE